MKHLAITWTDEALTRMVHRYTRESGVRAFEREIATVCRKIAKDWLAGGKPEGATFEVSPDALARYLGVEKYRETQREGADEIGLANGLAVTMVGGDLLPAEVTVVPGKGKVTLTGKLGDVMQESAQAAITYLRSRADTLGLPRDFQNKVDIHVHFPEGAIPKDGPSAGITIAAALVSTLTGRKIDRKLAMTGEITLRGEVLPIGGLKEKLLAAVRGGLSRVLIPEENVRDLAEIPDNIKNKLEIIPVKWIDRVLELALERAPQALTDEAGTPAVGAGTENASAKSIVTH